MAEKLDMFKCMKGGNVVEELIAGDQSLTAFLKPGDKPEAVFKTDAATVTAREYCNLHGLWKAEK